MKHHRLISRTPQLGQTALAVKLEFKVGLSTIVTSGAFTVSGMVATIFDWISDFPLGGGDGDDGGGDGGGGGGGDE